MSEHDEKMRMQIKNPRVAIKIQGFDNKYKTPSFCLWWAQLPCDRESVSAKAGAMKETFYNEITSKELVNKDWSISNHRQQIINLE